MTLLFGQGCSSNEFMVTSCLTTVKMGLIPLIKVCCNTGDVEIITYPNFLQKAGFLRLHTILANVIFQLKVFFNRHSFMIRKRLMDKGLFATLIFRIFAVLKIPAG